MRARIHAAGAHGDDHCRCHGARARRSELCRLGSQQPRGDERQRAPDRVRNRAQRVDQARLERAAFVAARTVRPAPRAGPRVGSCSVDNAASDTAAPVVGEVLRVWAEMPGDATVTTFANGATPTSGGSVSRRAARFGRRARCPRATTVALAGCSGLADAHAGTEHRRSSLRDEGGVLNMNGKLHASAAAGFSLIEVLVALVVLVGRAARPRRAATERREIQSRRVPALAGDVLAYDMADRIRAQSPERATARPTTPPSKRCRPRATASSPPGPSWRRTSARGAARSRARCPAGNGQIDWDDGRRDPHDHRAHGTRAAAPS